MADVGVGSGTLLGIWRNRDFRQQARMALIWQLGRSMRDSAGASLQDEPGDAPTHRHN